MQEQLTESLLLMLLLCRFDSQLNEYCTVYLNTAAGTFGDSGGMLEGCHLYWRLPVPAVVWKDEFSDYFHQPSKVKNPTIKTSDILSHYWLSVGQLGKGAVTTVPVHY